MVAVGVFIVKVILVILGSLIVLPLLLLGALMCGKITEAYDRWEYERQWKKRMRP